MPSINNKTVFETLDSNKGQYTIVYDLVVRRLLFLGGKPCTINKQISVI